MVAILAVAAGLTVLISDRLDDGSTGGGDQVVGGDTDSSDTTAVPPEGQVRVTGTLTALHVEGAVVDPREIPTPFTIVSERGFGNGGELTGVQVDGMEASVVWDGGRPFVLSSGGAMVLDPVTVDLAPEGVRLALGGAVHDLTPGLYQLDTPVAVGTSGVASSRDSVAFTAGEGAVFAANGDAALFLDQSSPRHLLGPGLVHFEGTLEVADADGTRPVATLDAAIGAFDITLTPDPGGGWTVTAVLEGELSTT